MTETQQQIKATLVKGSQARVEFLPRHLGIASTMRFENTVFTMADRFSKSYGGGMWDFYDLSNGGFFICPAGDGTYHFENEMNYADVTLSAQAFGIVCCLYTLSAMSFTDSRFADPYYNLLDYARQLDEAPQIYRAID